ncbi:four helix bundle protein [Spirosoma spitsbergense]|uniref:four helix bundle protein n=1 Tax=Spirosoma spitsbergense TaxID=431554 RepID=UPI001FE22300|nr:four helix bundle protein [Spirosoma spitsbergense]
MSERAIEYDGDKGNDQLREPVADYTTFSKSQFLDDIERRLKQHILRCVKVCRTLPVDFDAQHFGRQLVRSSSSAATNFRAVRRGRSQKEYYARRTG